MDKRYEGYEKLHILRIENLQEPTKTSQGRAERLTVKTAIADGTSSPVQRVEAMTNVMDRPD